MTPSCVLANLRRWPHLSVCGACGLPIHPLPECRCTSQPRSTPASCSPLPPFCSGSERRASVALPLCIPRDPAHPTTSRELWFQAAHGRDRDVQPCKSGLRPRPIETFDDPRTGQNSSHACPHPGYPRGALLGLTAQAPTTRCVPPAKRIGRAERTAMCPKTTRPAKVPRSGEDSWHHSRVMVSALCLCPCVVLGLVGQDPALSPGDKAGTGSSTPGHR
jgi:hypothetical protein